MAGASQVSAPTRLPTTTPLYGRLTRTVGPLVRAYARLEMRGLENLPAPGSGALLACNHSGSLWWDAFCLAAGVRDRQVHFVAHHWDARIAIARWVLGRLGAYFLDPDPESIDEGSAIVSGLRAGRALCIYPEESYHAFRDRYTLFDFTPHVLRYAHLADVPILPVAVIGVEEAAPTLFGWKPRGVPLHVPFHPPVILPLRVTIELGRALAFGDLAPQGDYHKGAVELRDHLASLIARYRDCRISDVRYLDEQRWF